MDFAMMRARMREWIVGYLDLQAKIGSRPEAWYTLEESVQRFVNEPQRSQILAMLEAEDVVMSQTRGSTNNHQAWPGGWKDHYADGMNIARVLFHTLNNLRPLPFTLHDALVAFFAHDIEKPWKYDLGEDGQWHHKSNFATKEDANNFRDAKLAEYGIELTSMQANAMKFAEGEIEGTYNNRERASSELAGFVHMVDHCSARVWHAYPAAADDPWKGSHRSLGV